MSKTYTKKQIQEAINFWKSKLDDEDFKIENLDESKNDDEEVEEVLPKELQNILNRTISAEWFAGNIYALFLTAIKKEDRDKVLNALFETSADEINDHLKCLVKNACD